MALALNLQFDDATDAAVRSLWQVLADGGISSDMLSLSYPPHLTLIVMDDDSLAEVFAPALERLAELTPRQLILGEVGNFAKTDVVYLGLDGDLAQLLTLHRAACALVPPEAVRSHYRTANWTPHVTLQSVGDASRALPLVQPLWRPYHAATTTRLELATFLPVVVGEGVAID